MAWSVNDIFNFTKWLIRENQAASISAGDFFYAWNGEQSAYFKDMLGRFQPAANNKTRLDTGLIENQTILTALAPFTKTVTIPVVAGEGDWPSDFAYELALEINGDEVIPITHGQKSSVNKSVIDPPSVSDGKYYRMYTEGKNIFLPSTVTSADLSYIAQPRDIVWGFDLDGSNRQVYNAIASVQPLWLQDDIIEITKRTMKPYGISVRDSAVAQFGQSIITQGS